MEIVIKDIRAEDRRFDLLDGAGSDAVHKDPQYGYGVTRLITADPQYSGTGIAYTLGGGTDLVSLRGEYIDGVLIRGINLDRNGKVY